jgi:hypothetical protein
VQADAQAASLAFYIRAAGWTVTDQAVGVWLNLGMVAFLEMAAALSLTVAAALRPVGLPRGVGAPPAPAQPAAPAVPAEPEKPATRKRSENDDDPPAPPPRKGRPGRPRDVLPAEAVAKIKAKGGKVSGSLNGIAKLIGSRSKTSVHRLLHELAGMGLVTMTTSPRGVAVALA